MEQNKGSKHGIVETYAEDIAKVIGDDTSGLVKKIIHEEEKHEVEKANLSPQSKKNRFFILVGLLFIILGMATLIYFFLQMKVPTVPVAEQFKPLIFNDKSIFVEVKGLKKDEIAKAVTSVITTTEIKKGGVEGIYLTSDKKVLSLGEFIELIQGNLQLQDKGFLMGMVNSETKDFFILFKVSAIVDVFPSLRLSEGKMFSDLHGFFNVEITPDTKYLLTKNFEDDIVENKNARVLYDNDHNIVMMYILADDNSVFITNTKSSAYEIMLRLAASRVKK